MSSILIKIISAISDLNQAEDNQGESIHNDDDLENSSQDELVLNEVADNTLNCSNHNYNRNQGEPVIDEVVNDT